jgi:hypothetical protein
VETELARAVVVFGLVAATRDATGAEAT